MLVQQRRYLLHQHNLVYDSMTYSNEDTDSNSQLDFLGPDIDEGFRLCAYAEKRQMIVSPKLVYLLLLAYENNVDNINVFNLNFRIVNYVAMKGVWENRLYPIIMFANAIWIKKQHLISGKICLNTMPLRIRSYMSISKNTEKISCRIINFLSVI